MKSTFVAIGIVLLLVAVTAGAYQYGYGRYGHYASFSPYSYQYQVPYRYPYVPRYYASYQVAYPSFTYYNPYVNPVQPGYGFGPGFPTTSYPVFSLPSGYGARSAEGLLCGKIDGLEFGCRYGLVCDFSRINDSRLGLCSIQNQY